MNIDRRVIEQALAIPPEAIPEFQTATGVSVDSRTIQSGELFIALLGQRDGHQFVAEAFAKGAVAAIVQRPLALAKPLIVVPDTWQALQRLAHFARRQHRGPVIAVGGSAGKTSTKEMIATILSQQFVVLKSFGNYNNVLGVSLTLLRWQPQHQIIVLEFGTNHPGEITALCELALPTIGLVTCIGPEHLEFFQTVEGVAKEELSLFEWLQTQDQVVVANMDDPIIAEFLSGSIIHRRLTFGFQAPEVDIRATILRRQMDKTLVRLDAAGWSREVTVPVFGQPMVHNAVAAAAVAIAVGLHPDHICAGLQRVRPLNLNGQGRMVVEEIRGITIINDTYNANPVSMQAALETLLQFPASGRRVAVLGDMLELGDSAEYYHYALLQWAAEHHIVVWTVGEIFGRLHPLIPSLQGYSCLTSTQCAEKLARELQPGDVVLFKGSRGLHIERIVQLWKQLQEAK